MVGDLHRYAAGNFPSKQAGQPNHVFDGARSVVVVGANGTGKTRLGTFVERQAGVKAHRISAQRSLVVPPFVQPRAYEQAESTLLYGLYEPRWDMNQRAANKINQRWGADPDVFMHNITRARR